MILKSCLESRGYGIRTVVTHVEDRTGWGGGKEGARRILKKKSYIILLLLVLTTVPGILYLLVIDER